MFKMNIFPGDDLVKRRQAVLQKTQPGMPAGPGAADMRIGWIGIGKMGSPMARAVLSAGYAVTVLEPLIENRASTVAAGAGVADSIEELAARSDVILTTVAQDDVLHDLVFGDGGLAQHLASRHVFVDVSTVSPRLSAEIGDVLAARAVDYLRAPVSGSTATAQSAQLTAMVSGPKRAWALVKPVLACFAARQFWVGEREEARYLKLAINVLVGGTSALLAEALAVGRAGGLPVSVLMDVICQSAVGSPLLAYKHQAIVGNDFDPSFSISQMIKDFELICEVVRQTDGPAELSEAVRRRFEAARRRGLGDRDYFVVTRDHEPAEPVDPVPGSFPGIEFG